MDFYQAKTKIQNQYKNALKELANMENTNETIVADNTEAAAIDYKAERKRAYTLELVKEGYNGHCSNPDDYFTASMIVSQAKELAEECERQGLLV